MTLPAHPSWVRTPPPLRFWPVLRNNARQPTKANTMTDDPKTLRIRELNDLFRTTWLTGTVLMTEGIRDLPDDVQSRIAEQVQPFSTFAGANDPHGEHDFGAFTVEGHKVFWKSTATRPT